MLGGQRLTEKTERGIRRHQGRTAEAQAGYAVCRTHGVQGNCLAKGAVVLLGRLVAILLYSESDGRNSGERCTFVSRCVDDDV